MHLTNSQKSDLKKHLESMPFADARKKILQNELHDPDTANQIYCLSWLEGIEAELRDNRENEIKELARDSNNVARAANELAREANDLARSANRIASKASSFTKRSSRIDRIIAIIAIIIAAIAAKADIKWLISWIVNLLP